MTDPITCSSPSSRPPMTTCCASSASAPSPARAGASSSPCAGATSTSRPGRSTSAERWDHARAGAYIDNPSDRDRWYASHRFDLPTAFQLAAEHLPTIRVNGVTAADLLTREAAQ
jgi:hypothetical protein